MKTACYSTALTLLLSLLIIGNASAEDSSNDLAAIIWVSNAPNESKPNRSMNFNFVRGETAYCSVIVKGFQTGQDGKLDLHADCEALDPEGKVMLLEKEYAKATGIAEAAQRFVQLDKSLDLTFEANDLSGVYSIRLVVVDRIAQTKTETTRRIRLFESKKTRDLFARPITEAKQLDDLWQYYFDTHDESAVKRIISVLPWCKDGHGMQIVLGGAAEWSLRSNAYQHTDVYSICQKVLSEGDETTTALLAELLAEVDKKKSGEKDKKEDK